ncbi:MAG: class I adenylate-forming enzyme family protein, partial [Parvibaculaceae bacterium]
MRFFLPDASSPSPNLNIPSDAEGDPPLIDCANVFDLLEQATAQSPGHVYCRQGEECVSRRELLGRVLTFADRLAAAGFQPGDRVAVMLENSIDYIVLVFAMAKMSLTWVPINTRLRGAGLAHILRHSEPRCLIADRALAPVITAASQGEPQCMILWQEESKSLLAESAEPHVPPAAAGTLPLGRHVFSISYTSGTTGWAKGVIVTHKMMAAASQAVLHLADVRDSDRMVMWEPLYHIGGSQLLLLPLLRLSTLTLAGKFSSKNFLSLLREAQATQLHYLGGVLQLMLKQPQSAKDKNHALRIAWGGGAPSNIWRAFEERFGVTLRECYGMTETSSIVTCNIEGVVGSIGRPLSWFSVSIVKQDGTRAQPRERGEIVVRQRVPGLLFEGYYKDEGTTRKALRGDALHTGDLGS